MTEPETGAAKASSARVDPWRLGLDHEASASAEERQRRGAWYTPRPVVEGLLRLAMQRTTLPEFVVDPTCGGGAFLLGALDRMVELGVPPGEAVGRVGGVDIDLGAVGAATRALDAWCDAAGVANIARLAAGDALDGLPPAWPRPELIIGNPPFATPLRGRLLPERAVAHRAERAALLGPYADLAAIHLAASLEHCAPGGRVCLVLPQSVLASRDVGGLRAHVEDVATPVAVWATKSAVFDAGVRVWAPVLELAGIATMVQLASGAEPTPTTRVRRAPLAGLAASALGAPVVDLGTGHTIGDDPKLQEVSATAGFRDEYYGLVDACSEASDGDPRPRLVTVGSLDPLTSLWGHRPTAFAKTKWERPVIDREAVPENIVGWVDRQLRPKVVLPTQSKVFEPVVDRAGRLVPATPVLSIHAAPESLNHLAALLLSPPLVAWAYRRWFGTALSVDAIKLAARDLSLLPTPDDTERWDEAAALVPGADHASPGEARHIADQVAELMTTAFAADPAVLAWWRKRLPKVTL